jgi:hypothetical protein
MAAPPGLFKRIRVLAWPAAGRAPTWGATFEFQMGNRPAFSEVHIIR